MAEKKSVFDTLNAINVNDKTEKKNGLTYLSWAWAWGEVKKKYPEAKYTVYENAEGWNYFTDGKTAWVKTGVEIDGIEYIEYLPVMDYKNQSIKLDQITSFAVNKTIQRSLTKAIARHGLGLYIYAGEDLPEEENTEQAEQAKKETKKKATTVDRITSVELQALNQYCTDPRINEWVLKKCAGKARQDLTKTEYAQLMAGINAALAKAGANNG